jgi:hypothetical protein
LAIIDRPAISSPASFTLPLRGGTQPTIDLSVVVLPAPLRPSSATVSPAPTESETERRMWLSP